jgi:hypothetical protein
MSNDFDPSILIEMLDRPIAYQRCFVTISKSVTAAVMLSQAIYWAKRTADADKWFYKSQNEWEEETGLTRSEQETARKKLALIGVLEEKKQGLPCRLYFRVNTKNLYSRLIESTNQDCNNQPDQYAEILQTSDRNLCILEGGIPANNLYAEITTENTSEIKARQIFKNSRTEEKKETNALENPLDNQDPNPPIAPRPPSPIFDDPMGDRFRDAGNKPKQVKSWQENDLFVRFIHKDLAQKSEYYKNQPYESAKHYIGKSRLSSPDMVLRFEELSDHYQNFLKFQSQRSQQQPAPIAVQEPEIIAPMPSAAREYAAKLARKAS